MEVSNETSDTTSTAFSLLANVWFCSYSWLLQHSEQKLKIRSTWIQLPSACATRYVHCRPSLVPGPRFPTAADGLHHRYVERGGDVIHPQLLGIWVWVRDYCRPTSTRMHVEIERVGSVKPEIISGQTA